MVEYHVYPVPATVIVEGKQFDGTKREVLKLSGWARSEEDKTQVNNLKEFEQNGKKYRLVESKTVNGQFSAYLIPVAQ